MTDASTPEYEYSARKLELVLQRLTDIDRRIKNHAFEKMGLEDYKVFEAEVQRQIDELKESKPPYDDDEDDDD